MPSSSGDPLQDRTWSTAETPESSWIVAFNSAMVSSPVTSMVWVWFARRNNCMLMLLQSHDVARKRSTYKIIAPSALTIRATFKRNSRMASKTCVVQASKCLKYAACARYFSAGKSPCHPLPCRLLHTSTCKESRNYYFIPPYSKVEPIKDEPRTEVIESKEDFKYVERLIPSMQIPEVPKHERYPTPSGWSPPTGAAPDTPYNVTRTRYHSIPAYIQSKKGGNQHWTLVRNVKGDIWALADDLKSYLEKKARRQIPVTVNEYTMSIRYKGLYEDEVKEWLVSKGF